jgi:hypothetical protein
MTDESRLCESSSSVSAQVRLVVLLLALLLKHAR